MSWHFWIFPVMFFWFFGFRRWGEQSQRARANWKAKRMRRMGRDASEDTNAETQSELEDQRGYIEAMELRIAELENRLDFTERLLARRPEDGAHVRGAGSY